MITLAEWEWNSPVSLLLLAPFAVGLVAIVVDGIRKSIQSVAREQARRDIAAYVAEGSMSPDDAAKLLAAGTKVSRREPGEGGERKARA
jgi:hypothetical protein